MAIGFSYLSLPQKYVENKEDFFRSGIAEVSKVRNLMTTCQRLFIANSKTTDLYLLGNDVYKILVYDHKQLIATLYYLPKEYRLDLFDESDKPMFVWVSKKCVYKSIPEFLSRVKAESLFLPLLAVL